MKKNLFFILLSLFFLVACDSTSDHTDQFRAFTESLIKSEEVIKAHNNLLYTTLEEKLRDLYTSESAKIWYIKAMQVKKLSKEMTAYIDQLKISLKEGTGSKMKKVEELSMKLTNYQDSVLEVLNPEEFKDNPILQSSSKIIKDNFIKTYPFYSHSGITSNYFEDLNTTGVLAMLQKIETEIAVTENRLLDDFNQATMALSHSCISFFAITSQSTSYCKKGENIEIYTGIGRFTSSPKPVITINGKQVPLDADEGVAKYTFKASETPGKHIVPVTIRYIQPDGSDAIFSKQIRYEVAK